MKEMNFREVLLWRIRDTNPITSPPIRRGGFKRGDTKIKDFVEIYKVSLT